MHVKRELAFFIDYIITSLIESVLLMCFIVYPALSGKADAGRHIMLKALGVTYLSVCYLIFRDVPLHGSLGKRIMKLKIISADTKKDAALSQRILRNIFWVLGPVEIIMYLFLGKRLGDMAAKTEVVPHA